MKKLIIFVLIIGVLILGFLFIKDKKEPVIDSNQALQNEPPTQIANNKNYSYSNDTYKFALNFPDNFRLKKDLETTCNKPPVDPKSEGGLVKKDISLRSGTKIPIIFEENNRDEIFYGRVGYKYSKDCLMQNILVSVRVEIIAQDIFLSNQEYLKNELKLANEGFVGSAAGGGAKIVVPDDQVENNGHTIIRSQGMSVMMNTTDTHYYFKGGFTYKLTRSYSGAVIGMSEQDRGEDYADQWRDYQMATEIINNFTLLH